MPPHAASSPPTSSPIQRLGAAGLWTGGFVLTYGAGLALLGGLGAPEPWIPLGAGIMAAVTFQAVGRRKVVRNTPTANYLNADVRLGRALDGSEDAEQVASMVIGTLRRSLKPRSAYLWLLDQDRRTFLLAAGVGIPPDADELPEARVENWLAANAGKALLGPDERIAAAELDRWLVRRELTWVEPLIAHGRTIGLLTLGTRIDGKSYGNAERWLAARAMREAGQALTLLDLERSDRSRRSRLDNLQARYKDAQQRAITDGLTGLTTHAFFKEQLAQRFHEAKRHNAPLGVLLVDIDHFKKINDTFGHPMGDEVLRQVSKAVKDLARACDTVARYGGEELALVLPRTDMAGAAVLAERIREAIAALAPLDSRGRPLPPITASIGVSALEASDEDGEVLIERADAALYLAKREGRNQVRRAS